MGDLLYESIVAILAFWIVLVIGFVMFICRLRMRRTKSTSTQSNSTESTFSVGTPQRRIQIYYIGNWDSNSILNSDTPNALNKVLAIVEDRPPRYEEISSINGAENGGIAFGREVSLVPMPNT